MTISTVTEFVAVCHLIKKKMSILVGKNILCFSQSHLYDENKGNQSWNNSDSHYYQYPVYFRMSWPLTLMDCLRRVWSLFYIEDRGHDIERGL